MGIMKLKEGADLTHPRVNLWWFVGAIVAIFVLLVAYAISKWGFGKVAPAASTALGNAPVIGSNATQTTDAAGWIY